MDQDTNPGPMTIADASRMAVRTVGHMTLRLGAQRTEAVLRLLEAMAPVGSPARHAQDTLFAMLAYAVRDHAPPEPAQAARVSQVQHDMRMHRVRAMALAWCKANHINPNTHSKPEDATELELAMPIAHGLLETFDAERHRLGV